MALHTMSLEQYLALSNDEQLKLNAFWVNPRLLKQQEDQGATEEEIEEGLRIALQTEPRYGWLGERNIFHLCGGAEYVKTVELGTFWYTDDTRPDADMWDDFSLPIQNVQFHQVFCVVDIES